MAFFECRQFCEADGEIALSLGVGRVRQCEGAADVEGLAEGGMSSGSQCDVFATPGERADAGAAAEADANILEGVQEIVEDLVDHLLIDGGATGELEVRIEFFCNAHAQAVGRRSASAVANISNSDGSLEDVAAGAVDIELAAGEPAKVTGVRSIEKEQGCLTLLRGEIDDPGALGFLEVKLEASLTGDAAQSLCFEFKKNVFVDPSLQNLH